MTSPITLGDNPAENRRVWVECLRRPDWRRSPADPNRECSAPWNVGVALAIAYWPPGVAIIDEYVERIDAAEAIMPACYGLSGENGEFEAAELPDRIRSIVLIAAQAAHSAPPYHDNMAEMTREIMAGFREDPEWGLYILSHCLMKVLGTRPVAPAGGGAAPGRNCPADCRHTGRRAAFAASAVTSHRITSL